ncbi:hypothetical protein [Streptococcus sp.]|uniref:DUF7679 family protein n=1 Tax=Streptococcus sp. TaxID=1306 RepID=UPI00290B87B5|nr:hypothetical protein [Streptococcus sp.]MDU6443572.1 hypothetical protein [Streptococcus sp.]MDU6640227.1 hypothetical protein [Streptococcus sp.]
MGKNYYYVNVRFLNGRKETFQLPKDLQAGLRHYRYDHPKDWEKLLTNALINVPSEPYLKKNRYQPLIRLAFVERFYSLKKQQRQRSRGQFLIKTNWQEKGHKHFLESGRFLYHDYSFKNKCVLFMDYYRWRRRYRKKAR